MKYPVFKKLLAVMTAAAVAVTPMSQTVLASGETQTQENVEQEARAGVLETALSSYDFADFSASGNNLTDGERDTKYSGK